MKIIHCHIANISERKPCGFHNSVVSSHGLKCRENDSYIPENLSQVNKTAKVHIFTILM